MAKVLVAERLDDRGLARLVAAGHDVDVRLGLPRADLVSAMSDVDALIVRSATRVDAELLKSAERLQVVGRAGRGVDNIDVDTATDRGVMVVSAPEANTVSNAEHAVALALAIARHIPESHAQLQSGHWERRPWMGRELYGKTASILGLGRVGRLVAERLRSFQMRVLAWDAYLPAEAAERLGVTLGELDWVAAEADLLVVMLPGSSELEHVVDGRLLSLMKPTALVVNAARGRLVDEEALADAIRDGRVAGAAIDTFVREPDTDSAPAPVSPLIGLPGVITTPHLGGSTEEAQERVATVVADQVVEALAGAVPAFAVNLPAAPTTPLLRPYVPLAESLARLFAALTRPLPAEVQLTIEGAIAAEDTRILVIGALRGLLRSATGEAVSYVNARQLAERLGVTIREATTPSETDYTSTISLAGAGHTVSGAIVAASQRIVELERYAIEAPLAPNLLLVRNDDRLGMVAAVGAALRDAQINIADMRLGRRAGETTALMVISTDQPVSTDVTDALTRVDGIDRAVALSL